MKRLNTKIKIREGGGGFTIIEILLVVVLIGLIGSIGGWLCVGTYKNMLVKKAARDFLLTAKYARILAVERQSPCSIEFGADGKRFALILDELNQETGETEQLTVRDIYSKPVEFGGDVKIEDIQINPVGLEGIFDTDEEGTIVFSPNGTSRSMIIQIGDGKNHYSVRISASTGKVKLYAGKVEDAEVDTVDLDG